MVPDYHLHTVLCKHAEGEAEEYRAAAEAIGIEEICFTDHVPSVEGYDPKYRMRLSDFPLYREMVERAGRKPRPRVLFGIEADYYEGCVPFLEQWLPEQDFDFVLGSVHYIDNWGFDDPRERSVWDGQDLPETWSKYFLLIRKLAETKLFDAVAHLDLPKKFGHRIDDELLKELAGSALDSIAECKMAVELNTSGLRNPAQEIYPSLTLLRMARERDIPICFGSDAHKPEQVAFKFDEAVRLARAAGYSQAVRFLKREKTAYPLISQ